MFKKRSAVVSFLYNDKIECPCLGKLSVMEIIGTLGLPAALAAALWL